MLRERQPVANKMCTKSCPMMSFRGAALCLYRHAGLAACLQVFDNNVQVVSATFVPSNVTAACDMVIHCSPTSENSTTHRWQSITAVFLLSGAGCVRNKAHDGFKSQDEPGTKVFFGHRRA